MIYTDQKSEKRNPFSLDDEGGSYDGKDTFS